MCGIAGIFSNHAVDETTLRLMTETLSHRGPDSDGIWLGQGIGFGHRRLAIQDLSSAGAQPMISASGRYVVCFNGEIYNHLELRAALNQDWKGKSDTETLLALIEQNGISDAINKMVGMFAFALFDQTERKLFLARDRMGEKPLYYGRAGQDVIFASELKALLKHPQMERTLSPEAVFQFLKHSYVPAPLSIFNTIGKLPGGHIVKLDSESLVYEELPKPSAYWSVTNVSQHGAMNKFEGDFDEAKSLFQKCLSKAVSGQLLSDAPLGCFLSGGVDSSLIAALMQEQSMSQVKSFSIGFDVPEYNEADHAKKVANHLNLDHHEMYITEQDALDVIPKLPSIYCEPFADASQIPTYLVSKMSQNHIKVALSGDGGDELMGGYNRYRWSNRVEKLKSLIPAPIVRAGGNILQNTPAPILDQLGRLLPKHTRQSDLGLKLQKLGYIMEARDSDTSYSRLISQWQRPETGLINKQIFENKIKTSVTHFSDPTHKMMLLDSCNYLPDDILVKVDRASMAASIEGRIPFLDHRLIELCWTLPSHFKTNKDTGKLLMRDLLFDYVPRSLIERPKSGFAVPLDSWLRGNLREWAEDLISEKALEDVGVFDVKKIRSVWAEHLSGKHNRQYQLWGPLMFQAWAKEMI